MCRYCDLENDGEYPDYHEFMVDDDFDFKVPIKFESSVMDISANVEAFFNMFIDINGKGELYPNISTDGNDNIIYEKMIKFNYCPMCGRKLSENDRGDE